LVIKKKVVRYLLVPVHMFEIVRYWNFFTILSVGRGKELLPHHVGNCVLSGNAIGGAAIEKLP
jgi:hypothetical protein